MFEKKNWYAASMKLLLPTLQLIGKSMIFSDSKELSSTCTCLNQFRLITWFTNSTQNLCFVIRPTQLCWFLSNPTCKSLTFPYQVQSTIICNMFVISSTIIYNMLLPKFRFSDPISQMCFLYFWPLLKQLTKVVGFHLNCSISGLTVST